MSGGHREEKSLFVVNTGGQSDEESRISTFCNASELSREEPRSSAATSGSSSGSTSGVSSHSSARSTISDSPFRVQDSFQISSVIEKTLQKYTDHLDRSVSELKSKMDDISQRLYTLEVAVMKLPGNSHPQSFDRASDHLTSTNSTSLPVPDHSSQLNKSKGDNVRASKCSTDSDESVKSDTPTETTSTHVTSKESYAPNVESCGATAMQQLQHKDIRASQYSTNSNDSVKSDTPTEETTTCEKSEGISDEVTVKVESFATEQRFAGQSSIEEFTATVPRLMDSASITNGVTDFEVSCNCNSQHQLLRPLILNNETHFVVQTTGRWLSMGTKKSQGYVESYNLLDGRKDKSTFNNCKKIVCPSLVLYFNKVTILGGDSDIGSRRLYQLNYRSNSSYSFWDRVLNSKHSPLQLELKDSLCVPYENEKVVNVNILHQIIRQEFFISLIIYLFSPSPMAGKYWISANIPLRNVQSLDSRKYKIQSGVIFQNHLYCSLLLPGTKMLVCKVDMAPLQQCKTTYEVSNSWSLADSLLSDCFLAVFDGECVAVTFKDVNNKTIMEVRQCSHSFISSSEYHFEFPSAVKVLTASVLGENVIIVYHDTRVNKCFVKKFIMYQ